MGEVADLLGAEHQQEGHHSRPADRRGSGRLAPLDRNRRGDRREFHPSRARPDRAGLRSDTSDSTRCDPAADAGFRSGRAVAGQPGVRLCHRGRVRGELADRLPRPQPLRAVLDRRPERRHPRCQCAAARAGAPARHRPGRHDRGRDDRRGTEHRVSTAGSPSRSPTTRSGPGSAPRWAVRTGHSTPILRRPRAGANTTT